MRRLIVTRLAKRDLTSIVGYIGNTSRSVPTAQAFGRKLVDRCNRLAALPGTFGCSGLTLVRMSGPHTTETT